MQVSDPFGFQYSSGSASLTRSASMGNAIGSGQIFAIGYTQGDNCVFLIGSLTNGRQFELASLPLGARGTVKQILKFGGLSYVAGSFQAVQQHGNGFPVQYIASIDKTLHSSNATVGLLPLGGGLNGAVRAIAEFQGYLIAGGTFTMARNSNTDSAVSCGGLATWNPGLQMSVYSVWLRLVRTPIHSDPRLLFNQ